MSGREFADELFPPEEVPEPVYEVEWTPELEAKLNEECDRNIRESYAAWDDLEWQYW